MKHVSEQEKIILDSTLQEKIKEEGYRWQSLRQEVQKQIVGNDKIIDRIIISVLCNAHVLLEGVPGLAKTTLIKSFSQALDLDYQRIQFTPDLLPADLIGTLVFNPKTQEFTTKKGPIFANLILADEINRAPAKVQSALLEAMQEKQVTIGDTTYSLDQPFLVFATQNPIDQEGTYHLPEAQVDRFMFKLLIQYPTKAQEKEILFKTENEEKIQPIFTRDILKNAQKLIHSVYIDDKVVDYILSIVSATRKPEDYKLETLKPFIEYGASPRATIALYHATKAYAFFKKRHFVIPDDVKAMAPDILRHRVIVSYEAEAENISPNTIIEKILLTLPSP